MLDNFAWATCLIALALEMALAFSMAESIIPGLYYLSKSMFFSFFKRLSLVSGIVHDLLIIIASEKGILVVQ